MESFRCPITPLSAWPALVRDQRARRATGGGAWIHPGALLMLIHSAQWRHPHASGRGIPSRHTSTASTISARRAGLLVLLADDVHTAVVRVARLAT